MAWVTLFSLLFARNCERASRILKRSISAFIIAAAYCAKVRFLAGARICVCRRCIHDTSIVAPETSLPPELEMDKKDSRAVENTALQVQAVSARRCNGAKNFMCEIHNAKDCRSKLMNFGKLMHASKLMWIHWKSQQFLWRKLYCSGVKKFKHKLGNNDANFCCHLPPRGICMCLNQ